MSFDDREEPERSREATIVTTKATVPKEEEKALVADDNDKL